MLEKDFRKMMGRFTTGVAVVTTEYQGKPMGVTINTLTSVSLSPPLVLFCLGKKRLAFQAFSQSTHLAIHILSAHQQELCRSFSMPSSHPWDKTSYKMSSTNCPLIENSLGILHCRHEKTYDGGDHMIFLNQVEAIHWDHEENLQAPLIYFQGKFL